MVICGITCCRWPRSATLSIFPSPSNIWGLLILIPADLWVHELWVSRYGYHCVSSYNSSCVWEDLQLQASSSTEADNNKTLHHHCYHHGGRIQIHPMSRCPPWQLGVLFGSHCHYWLLLLIPLPVIVVEGGIGMDQLKLVPKKFVSKGKLKWEEKKNIGMAQEMLMASLGPFFIQFPCSHHLLVLSHHSIIVPSFCWCCLLSSFLFLLSTLRAVARSSGMSVLFSCWGMVMAMVPCWGDEQVDGKIGELVSLTMIVTLVTTWRHLVLQLWWGC